MRLLRSWWKQESLVLRPLQRQRLLRISAVLLLGLVGLNLQRHHQEQLRQRNTQLQQASELAGAQWETIRATAYDWAHWDETHAYARGMAPGYPARNLEVANGLTSVAPVVVILNRSGDLLTLQGRGDHSDPLVRCTSSFARPVLSRAKTHGISCRDQGDRRLWIGVIEPVTDTNERDEPSGLLVLLAPLRHPSHGPELRALMENLERQLQLAPPGPSALLMQGRSIWGNNQRVLHLKPEPVLGASLQAVGRDVAVGAPFVLFFLALRAALLLQRRQQDLNQRRSEQRSRRRLRRARRQLDALFNQLPLQERERALSRLALTNSDPIDDLARRLEAYGGALERLKGGAADRHPLHYAPMHNAQSQLQRLRVQSFPLNEADLVRAVTDWAALPAGWRQTLGLQIKLTAEQWCDASFLSTLKTALAHHACPHALCTLAARVEQLSLSAPGLLNTMAQLRAAGFGLALNYNGNTGDPSALLHRLPFSELQLQVPSLITPNLQKPQQALFTALVHLGKARGLQVSAMNLQTEQQLRALNSLHIDLFSGPLIGRASQDPADLLIQA